MIVCEIEHVQDELEIVSKFLGQKGRYSGTRVVIKNKRNGEIVAEGRHSLFSIRPSTVKSKLWVKLIWCFGCENLGCCQSNKIFSDYAFVWRFLCVDDPNFRVRMSFDLAFSLKIKMYNFLLACNTRPFDKGLGEWSVSRTKFRSNDIMVVKFGSLYKEKTHSYSKSFN